LRFKMASFRPMSLLNFVFIVFYACDIVRASDEFIVTHVPDSLQFLPTSQHLPLSQISDLVTSTYGLTPKHSLTWDGLSGGNMFKRPKATVMFSFDGFKDSHSLSSLKHVARYPTHSDVHFVNTQSVSHQLKGFASSPLVIDFSAANSVFDIKADYPELFSRLPGSPDDVIETFQRGESALQGFPLGSLNVTRSSDLVLLAELELIQEMIESLRDDPALTKDNVPDFFHFRLSGFQMLTDSGKPAAVNDALNLIKHFLEKATGDFSSMYGGDVVIQVITMSGKVNKPVRKGRSLLSVEELPINPLNLAAKYSGDYAVVFNLVFWPSLMLALIVLSVSVCLWNMDPGRDSIIYRMTSQRMKKD